MKAEEAKKKVCLKLVDRTKLLRPLETGWLCIAVACMAWTPITNQEIKESEVDEKIPDGWKSFNPASFHNGKHRIVRNVESEDGDCVFKLE